MPPTAHLLPNYDEYFIGFRDRSAIGQRLSNADLVTGGSSLIAHVVAIDGQLVGGWKRLQEREATVIEMNLMVKLTQAERARLDKTIDRLQRFADTSLRVNHVGIH
jgi:hypothetical protein